MTADNRMREGPVGRFLHVLCDICAVVGGAVLIAMAIMTVVSVIGRTFFDSPILGDVELVQLAWRCAWPPFCRTRSFAAPTSSSTSSPPGPLGAQPALDGRPGLPAVCRHDGADRLAGLRRAA